VTTGAEAGTRETGGTDNEIVLLIALKPRLVRLNEEAVVRMEDSVGT
jgi:hypothetical protein